MMTPKPDITLLPPDAILAMADVMTRANTPEKHQDAKWKRMTPEEHIAAALRHTFAWLNGEKVDPELGTSHLANASVRMSMALSLVLRSATTDTSSLPSTYKEIGLTPWWAHQDEAGWEGSHDADGSEPEFKVGDRVVLASQGKVILEPGYRPFCGVLEGTVTRVDPYGVVEVKWDVDQGSHIYGYSPSTLRHIPKTLDDFTPDQWDTAADRSKDIWAETKV